MITCSKQIDLGRDKERMKDTNDALRQTATVNELLKRLFNPKASDRFELQILADEVGMGKTFVALGVAYSILEHMKQSRVEGDLDKCYQRILVIVPNNHALFRKWVREVAEFKERCVLPGPEADAICFQALEINRMDDLGVALRKGGRQPQVLIARMGLFGGDKLVDYDLKRRFMLRVLFRYWGNSFNMDQRGRLLKGAPSKWPANPADLTGYDEEGSLPFSEDQLITILRDDFDASDKKEVDSLLEACRELARPFYRDRASKFPAIEKKILKIYKLAAWRSLQKDFPLLIVDEAHNWKNGPSGNANGFGDISANLLPRVRRSLLLTATPFQLRPDEMLEIQKVADFMAPCPTKADTQFRNSRLNDFREKTIRRVLGNAEKHSRQFSRQWSRLPRRITTDVLGEAWAATSANEARIKISELAQRDGVITDHSKDMSAIISNATVGVDPDISRFLKAAFWLYAYNEDLSRELGKVVVRHRRLTNHRQFQVGGEYGKGDPPEPARPDAHILHASPGLDIRGDAELPQYILMKCVSAMKNGKGKSSLGSDLTGCYSTLKVSAEGRRLEQSLAESHMAARYFSMLFEMVDESHDSKHPKMAAVVAEALTHWHAGEKVLIFCFRVNTAERLNKILREKVQHELAAGKMNCLGGEGNLTTLRGRLTGRDRDLVVLGLDRVLWSYAWAFPDKLPYNPDELVLTDVELMQLASLSLRFNVDVVGDRVDRVFLTRATEHILASRIYASGVEDPILKSLLMKMKTLDWVSKPYTGESSDDDEGEGGEADPSFDARGCHAVYEREIDEPLISRVEKLASDLRTTRERARGQKQTPILDGYGLAPSLWLGPNPVEAWRGKTPDSITLIHKQLWRLTSPVDEDHRRKAGLKSGEFDFNSRLMAMQALRRAVLRESVLLRFLPKSGELPEAGWGDLLASAFLANLPNQHESMAARIAVFLQDLNSCSGSIDDRTTARGALYDATLLRDQQFVALVKGGGGTKSDTRDRVFNGFNTPLLPEILVCTQVGQEGIDLHRHCRHVVHYDLAWNPAVLEQRTGRADRIGSKTFRERDAAKTGKAPFLEIGVPFLAGTYDERMYEELRLRAMVFEVLTGGDFSADHAEGQDDAKNAEGKEIGARVTPLPQGMVDDLRVKLHVWQAKVAD